MNASFLRAARSVTVFALWAAAACGGATSRGGSETNWFVSCVEDSDCRAGVCACGICTDVCTTQTECPGDGRMLCVQRGSPAHDRLCTATRDAPAGICLAACRGNDECAGNEICADGACAPSPSWKREHPQAGATGAPCVPDDLRRTDFGGYDPDEVSVESRSPSCESALCIVNNFQGRQGCPYGSPCTTTGAEPSPVTASVPPQLVVRAPSDVSTCSCRCDGAPGTGPFCACPDDFDCRPLVGSFGAPSPLEGSYCVKRGTSIDDPAELDGAETCDRALANCEGR